MTVLRLVLTDQLSLSIASLQQCDKAEDIILLCESLGEFTKVKHHKKKIVFLLAAMRKFAIELQSLGYKVFYSKIDDPHNTQSLKGEVLRLLGKHTVDKIVVTCPGDYDLLAEIQSWQKSLNILVDIQEDTRFLASRDFFNHWAKDRKILRMEYFYREMRKKYNILMEDNFPVGGKWNYDKENRKPPQQNINVPKPYVAKLDDISKEVMEIVANFFPNHFGDIHPFYLATTRVQALQVLKKFIQERLYYFGDYQDAMLENEPWMYHSHISFYLNCGLLLPLECVSLIERAYYQGKVPLNAAEGFIRQIIGWREYIRGIYWLNMPEYKQNNFFNAVKPLPDFYWTGVTKMNCVHQCVTETKQNAYAHHIQRLMVLGNFALLAGIDPLEVSQWFLIVYADAFEWVELPNVIGMILFADGGYLASKPYAAGGAYINKMSNYCKNCIYKVSKKNGKDACPFNYLYWDFLVRNKEKLQKNQRIAMLYQVFAKMDHARQQQIFMDSKKFLESI